VNQSSDYEELAMNLLNRTLRTMLPVAVAMLPMVLTTVSANAEARERTVNRTGPNGLSTQRVTSRVRSGDTVTSHSTVTGPKGKTASRSSAVSYDPATKTLTRDTVATGPNGKAVTTDATTVRTDNGVHRDVVKTGPNGNTVTHRTETTVSKK
jgi:hypothetical protein